MKTGRVPFRVSRKGGLDGPIIGTLSYFGRFFIVVMANKTTSKREIIGHYRGFGQ